MLMPTHESMLADLLCRHDCVIVPEFGGFVVNYGPARISAVGHRMDPPGYRITFNRLLSHNDGLLVSEWARVEKCTYEQSIANLRTWVIEMNAVLNSTGVVVLQGVGTVTKTIGGTYRFEQGNILLNRTDVFGLESFFARPLKTNPGVVTDAIPSEESSPVSAPVTAVRERRMALRAAASFAGILVLSYAGWLLLGTPLIKDPVQFHASDLNPFTEKICPEYKHRENPATTPLPESVTEADTAANGEFIELMSDIAPDKTIVVRLKDRTPAYNPAHSSAGRFHVIGGCFGVVENAQRMVSALRSRGLQATVVDQKGGLHRVSMASYATREEAETALDALRPEAAGAWILYK